MKALDQLSTQDGHDDDGRPHITTIATSVWAFSTLIWSLLTPPHLTFPARVLLLQPTWIIRILRDDKTWVQDLLIFLLLHAGFTFSNGIWSLPRFTGLSQLRIDSETLWIYFRIFTLLAGCGMLAAAIVIRGKQLADAEAKARSESTRAIEENPIPPLLIPSRTTHTRFVPTKHSFAYSYLLVGVPVGATKQYGSALSVDSPKRGWFHVSGADHLNRSEAPKTLSQKLNTYLRTQGITSQEYEFAYLVTAPRFLGYNFNPVSFWYIYDEEMRLKYMILEVNNTFDERHMYLLKPSKDEETVNNASAEHNGRDGKIVTFSQTWEKDFHVSPFNSRKGTYSLRAMNPLAASEKTGSPVFDNTITLRSSKDETKIVARVRSVDTAYEPEQLSSMMLARFVISWWWVGLVTFPRIVWQAQKLFLSKKLMVYFRPEVTKLSVGRTFTDDERSLEAFFHAFIAETVEDSQQPLRVVYELPHGEHEAVFYSSSFTYREDHETTLTLRVLTPAFYSRFVHYAHAKEAFDRECLSTDERNRTVIIEPANLLTVLLESMRNARTDAMPQKSFSPDGVWWSLVTHLRCPPSAASYTSTQNSFEMANAQDIRSFGPSELDMFVRTQCEDAQVYLGILTKIFIAQRFLFGMPILVTLIDWMLRASMITAAIMYISSADHFDLLRPRIHTRDDTVPIMTMLLLANAVHIWAMFTAQD